jgi:predicted Zn-dependent protease
MGHTFKLEHCGSLACIMQVQMGDEATRDAIVSGRPFCDPCVENLEITGYQLLAKQ